MYPTNSTSRLLSPSLKLTILTVALSLCRTSIELVHHTSARRTRIRIYAPPNTYGRLIARGWGLMPSVKVIPYWELWEPQPPIETCRPVLINQSCVSKACLSLSLSLSVHPSCYSLSEVSVRVLKSYPWQCMDCKTCQVLSYVQSNTAYVHETNISPLRVIYWLRISLIKINVLPR